MKRIRICFIVLLLCFITLSGCGRRKSEAQDPGRVQADTMRVAGQNLKRMTELIMIEREQEEKEQDEEKASEREEVGAQGQTQDPNGDMNENENVPTVQKKGILIALDPGHQGWNVNMSDLEPNAPDSSVMKAKATSGTSGRFSGIPEFELNLAVSLLVRDRLVQEGYDVLMTREDNETAISNAQRALLANESGADIAVRIHANGSENPDANGALVLLGSSQNPYVGFLYEQSSRLGSCVLDAYCNATGMQNLGFQENDTMTGINWSKIPVIILEMGFMTNQQDDLNMADEQYRIRMAEGIVNGINAYYGY